MGLDFLPEETIEMLAFGDLEPAVGLDEFFGPAFMREHTRFETFAAFREESPWAFEDREDVDAIPVEELDAYVDRTTEFETWVAMRNEAAERAVIERLTL